MRTYCGFTLAATFFLSRYANARLRWVSSPVAAERQVVPGLVMRTGTPVRAEDAHGHGDDDR